MKSTSFLFVLFLAVLFSMAGCAVVPPPIIHQPMTIAPQSAKPQRELNGAIYQSASYRPLFEDQKGRLLGDVLTISISEKTSAGKAGASSANKSGSTSFNVPSFLGLSSAITSNAGLSSTSSSKFDSAGAQTASNNFTGTIAVTVIDVLPNGNLLVSGEKQIAFDQGAEYVRFSGVVTPASISAANVVASGQVADARFEYRSTARIDRAEVNSLLTRFFLSFIPL
ncbi:flagellar basal body L-ring protein FlgH [Undibacterium sp. RTI2.1]|uniref:flagellar basal body L-ring protein FlgH n=1 Tax=unclassified Undibacterium TaxID=2630295 RepID=UPI002AB4CCCC|nr:MULTISPECIES: flagellar basal body L-ring protein FlgH [unclassified Undibacterium]MDY7537984.1 flagellar basal body L-ring protein FlgH [Undibacterium sp. 5I1]MEB0032037.1 flagellar basal body L-ring protein FlgH [Undibacterium sp. RTI2.1]MEB0117233.1 flagellar basal body L-ring protein FlgH [Undibacterium sp. RTI2.2]MEB0231074.1 flagellar basal body L-ring protein FlgH [Undibacterium sp. 10I3]MEB0257527.1 flagellar basal body L-ring protein FlgH [Undibacterium sp. 5I1]